MFALSLSVQVALDRPSVWRLLIVVVLAAALVWTHAWGVALIGAAIAVGVARLLWSRRVPLRRPGLPRVLVALVVGCLAVVPLLVAGSPLLGSDGFGTRPFRPATLLLESLTDFHDGTGVLLYLSLLLVVLGVFGVRRDDWRVDLDLHSVRDARAPALVLVVAMGLVSVAGLASKATLQPGAVAVFFPFFVVLAALGLSRFSGRSLLAVGAVFAVLAAVSLGGVAGKTRTEAGAVVDALARSARGRRPCWCAPPRSAPRWRGWRPTASRSWRGRSCGRPFRRTRSTRRVARRRAPTRPGSRRCRRQAGSSPLYFVQGAIRGVTGIECGSGLDAVGGADPALVRGSSQEDAQSEPMRLYTGRR